MDKGAKIDKLFSSTIATSCH